jgi:uncharacterized protein YkwD
MRRTTTRRLRRLAVTPLLAAAAIAAVPALADAAPCSGDDRAPAALGSAETNVTLCLLNNERAAHGLRPLRLDRKLSRAARGHSRDMVAKRYFAHDSRSGASFSSRIKRAGWMRGRRAWTVGENIGWGEGTSASPRAMVSAWMHSAGHRANILERHFRLIGIGIALGAPTGANDGATYATDFGG